ncbi:hypothetical protein FOXYS1_12082, partial [Fusarium oxysporum]
MTRGQKRQATAESRGSGSDGGVRGDEVGNIGCHEKQNKRKRPAIDEEKQPGWWPRNYAPGNPRCTRILGGMRSLIRTYQKAGRDPNDMWKEDGEDGCMVKAIRELGQGRVTQRVFKRVKPPFVTVEKPTKRAVGTDKRKLKREGSSAVENNTHDESTDDLANPHSPSCQGDGDESASRDNHSMLEPECPQQKDDFNCGIFVLAFLLSLLNGESIPSQVNAKELRIFLAARIEATAPTEPAKPIQKL